MWKGSWWARPFKEVQDRDKLFIGRMLSAWGERESTNQRAGFTRRTGTTDSCNNSHAATAKQTERGGQGESAVDSIGQDRQNSVDRYRAGQHGDTTGNSAAKSSQEGEKRSHSNRNSRRRSSWRKNTKKDYDILLSDARHSLRIWNQKWFRSENGGFQKSLCYFYKNQWIWELSDQFFSCYFEEKIFPIFAVLRQYNSFSTKRPNLWKLVTQKNLIY